MEQYTYSDLPLQVDPDAVRLLEILPGSGGEDVTCLLNEAFLLQEPEYEALSCCWGKEEASNLIIVRISESEDRALPVKPNLFAALKQLRHPDRSRFLWVDAICINQVNDSEKGHQVMLMRRIYEGASETIVWLGESDENSWRAIWLMLVLARSKILRAESNDTRYYYQLGAEGQKEYGLPYPLDPAFSAFSALLNRPWFSRVWIIQEVAVSKVVTIMCGAESVPWKILTCAVDEATTRFIPGFWSNTSSCERIVQLEAARESISSTQRQPILTLLTLYRSFNATDLRDKIFSLLGISDDMNWNGNPDGLNLVPDYSKDSLTSSLYHNFATSSLQSGSLDILSIPRTPVNDSIGVLPSWVPDWSVADSAQSLRYRIGRNYLLPFEATPLGLRPSPQFDEGGSVVGLEGHIIDKISAIGEVHDCQVDGSLSWFQRLTRVAGEQAIFNNWEAFCKYHSETTYIKTNESIVDAYWQTLCVGQTTPEGKDATAEEFMAWNSCVRKPSRFVPSSKYLRWTHSFLSLAVTLALGATWCFSKIPLEKIMKFRQRMTVINKRRIFRSRDGLIGIAPQLARKGDSIALFKGGMIPLVIRKAGERWELIGDSYVHGIMHGEVFEEGKCETLWIE